MKKSAILSLSVVCLFLFSCHSNQPKNPGNNQPSVLKFNKHTLNDDDGLKMQVCSFLVPDGWTTDASIKWNIQDVQLPAQARLKVSKPESSVSMEGFPDMLFLVSSDPDLNETYPAGSKFFAAKVINITPTVLDLMRNEIIPLYRNYPDLTIVEEKNLSLEESNHQRAKEFKGMDSKSGVIRLEYTENGQAVEETIYGTMSFFPMSENAKYAALSMCYACKAPKGELKSNMGIFETVLNSVKMNPKWTATFVKVTQLAMQRAFNNPGSGDGGYSDNDPNYSNGGNSDGGFQNGGYAQNGSFGSLNDYVTQAGSQIDNSIIRTYQNQQASNDKVFEGYSDYMLDYQNFTDPNSGDVYKLSSGYSNAWTDNSGSVIMSNDVGYDPNTGGGGSSWTSLSTGGTTVAAPAETGSGGE